MAQRLWRIIISLGQDRTDLKDTVPGEKEEHPLSVYHWFKLVAWAKDEREAVNKVKEYLRQFPTLGRGALALLERWHLEPAKCQVEPVEGDVQGFFYSELDWSRRKGWEEHLIRIGSVLEAVVIEKKEEGDAA